MGSVMGSVLGTGAGTGPAAPCMGLAGTAGHSAAARPYIGQVT